MSPLQLLDLGRRLRTQVRGQLLDYIDGTLQIVAQSVTGVDCPVCAKRRKEKAEAQKRWRRKSRRAT